MKIYSYFEPGRPNKRTLSAHLTTYAGYTIPQGFTWDGASVPRLLYWFAPRWGRYELFYLRHDYEYEYHSMLRIGRKESDTGLYKGLVAAGMCKWRASIIYYAVRLTGKGGWK